MAVRRPFNLTQWLKDNRHLLKPPVGNKNLYADAGDFIVMVVAGPNARKDYHFNVTEELYYQLEGNITVKIQEDGRAVEIPLAEGDMFLLPGSVPHCPIRTPNSLGLVIEAKRHEAEDDGLMWFCEKCNHKLHEYKFHLNNIETDFIPRFREFYGSKELRTCKNCNTVMEADPRFV